MRSGGARSQARVRSGRSRRAGGRPDLASVARHRTPVRGTRESGESESARRELADTRWRERTAFAHPEGSKVLFMRRAAGDVWNSLAAPGFGD